MSSNDVVIKAEVFRIIRANSDKSSKTVLKLLKEHLPDVSTRDLQGYIGQLYGE